MVIGICRLNLMFAGSQSLKAKRHGLRSLIDRMRSKFNVAVAEVAHQESWQRATVGWCVVGNDGGHVRTMMNAIQAFVERLSIGQVLDHQVELLHFDDDLPWDSRELTWERHGPDGVPHDDDQ